MERNQESEIDNEASSLCFLEWMNQFGDDFVEQVNDKNESDEFTDTKGTNLLDLNDYCLLDIFSVKSLDFLDLYSLAKSCERFQPLISRIIPERVTIWRRAQDKSGYGHLYEGWTWLDRRPRMNIEVRRIFKQFGSIFSEVHLLVNEIKDHEDCFALDLVAKYCVGDVLKTLSIEFHKIGDILAKKLKPIFNSLSCLHLSNVTIGDPTLFTSLDSLTELQLRFGKSIGAILKNVLPKLQTLSYGCYEFDNELLETFLTFFSRHKTLKSLELYVLNCYNTIIKDGIFQAISNKCKQLEKLFLGIGTISMKSVLPLQSLKLLKVLQLCYIVCEDFEFFSEMKELRSLILYRCQIPSDVNEFVHLNRITRLSISRFSNLTFDVVSIVRQLQDLEILELSSDVYYTNFHLNEIEYSKIVDIVKDRYQMLTMYCNSNVKLTKCVKNLMLRLVKLEDFWKI